MEPWRVPRGTVAAQVVHPYQIKRRTPSKDSEITGLGSSYAVNVRQKRMATGNTSRTQGQYRPTGLR